MEYRIIPRRLIRCALTLLLVGSLVACDALRKDDKALVEAARQYIENHDVRAAAIELQNALKLNPKNAEARYLLATINLQVGSAVVAEKEFRQAGEFGAPMQDVATGLALALLEQKHLQQLLDEVTVSADWPKQARASVLAIRAAAENAIGRSADARKNLAMAADLQPDNMHVLTSRARLLISEKNDSKALAVLDKAQALYPRSQDVLFLKAGIAYKNNQQDEIKKILYRVIEVDLPKIVTVYEWRARLGVAQILLEEGAISESQAVIEPLMSRINRDADSLYLAAMLSFKRGEYELAGQRLHKVLELDSNHRPGLLLLGSVNYFLGEYEQAAYYLSKYVATAPDDLSARKLLGKAYLELEAHNELRTVLEPILASKHSDAEVLAMMGMSALRSGQLQAGVADIEKAVAMSPDNTRLREFLARAYIISGEPDRAIKELENVLSSGDERNAEVLLILAHLRAGDTEKAKVVATDMVREHPNNPKILTVAGNVYLVGGNSEQALEYFNDALNLAPEFMPAALAVARVYENDGEFSRARSQYERLIQSADQKVVPMMALANLEERQNQIERMVYWLNEAVSQNPPQVSPRLMLASHYLGLRKPVLAKALIEEALEIEPRNLSARLLQVRALMLEQRYAQALPVLTELAENRPDSISVSVLLAESYLRMNKLDEALLVSRQILDRQPENIPANMLMAATSMSSAQYRQALVYAEKLTELKPDWYKAYEITGDIKSAMQDYSGAERAYRQAMEREKRRELSIKIAQSYMYRNKLAQAERQLDEWIMAHAIDEQSLLLLGIIYQRQDKLDKAVKAYNDVLAIDANNSVALNNLAGLYDLMNDPRALTMGERAYRSNPDAADIQDTYGWLLSRYGDASEGKRLLEKALTQIPGNPDIRFHLAVAMLNNGEKSAAKVVLKQLLSENIDFAGKQEAIEIYNKIK